MGNKSGEGRLVFCNTNIDCHGIPIQAFLRGTSSQCEILNGIDYDYQGTNLCKITLCDNPNLSQVLYAFVNCSRDMVSVGMVSIDFL